MVVAPTQTETLLSDSSFFDYFLSLIWEVVFQRGHSDDFSPGF